MFDPLRESRVDTEVRTEIVTLLDELDGEVGPLDAAGWASAARYFEAENFHAFVDEAVQRARHQGWTGRLPDPEGESDHDRQLKRSRRIDWLLLLALCCPCATGVFAWFEFDDPWNLIVPGVALLVAWPISKFSRNPTRWWWHIAVAGGVVLAGLGLARAGAGSPGLPVEVVGALLTSAALLQTRRLSDAP
jgi:hypothetical protein